MESKKSKIIKKVVVIGFIMLAFLLGGVSGWILSSRHNSQQVVKVTPIRSPESPFYKFIDPLVGFDVAVQQDFPELLLMKNNLEKYFAVETSANHLKMVGVYFRTLNDGHWFGIDDETGFHPGSLLKVPIMIAYFKKAETEQGFLQKKILYKASNTLSVVPPNSTPSLLTNNTLYTVEDLIKAMIIQSDNGAKDALIDAIESKYLEEVLREMGFSSIDEAATISPRLYANFFRRLHNSTFLSREDSEKALNILSQTEFVDGIRKGVPDSVPVAHKFGERGVYEENRLVGVELHDCGIIYQSSNHYLLCVMTSGYDEKILAGIIQKASSIVYTAIQTK